MTTFAAALHEDSNGVETSARYGDPGDGVSDWYLKTRTVDGADVTQGAKADAAVTNPATSASIVAILKGVLTRLATMVGAVKVEDDAAASADAGVPMFGVRNDTYAARTSTDGDYGNVAITDTGAQLARPVPSALTAFAPTNATVTAYAASLVVKASAGVLYGISGYNSNAADRFIQIHNAAALPADGVAPVVLILVKALSPFAIDFGVYGRAFSTGIVICNSTSGPTKAIGTADAWIDAQYK